MSAAQTKFQPKLVSLAAISIDFQADLFFWPKCGQLASHVTIEDLSRARQAGRQIRTCCLSMPAMSTLRETSKNTL